MNEESKRKARKAASEDIRKAMKSLTTAGDHGTAILLKGILYRLTERRMKENKRAGLQ